MGAYHIPVRPLLCVVHCLFSCNFVCVSVALVFGCDFPSCAAWYRCHGYRCCIKKSRVAAYKVLVELARSSLENFSSIVQHLITIHHASKPSNTKEWEVHLSLSFSSLSLSLSLSFSSISPLSLSVCLSLSLRDFLVKMSLKCTMFLNFVTSHCFFPTQVVRMYM